MPVEEAFLAVALAAVSWDGTMTPAGSRALRHAIDYRPPYCDLGEQRLVLMIDSLLTRLRQQGAQHLMLAAGEVLSRDLRRTAYAMAAEIMRSDGPLEADELNILASLATNLDLAPEEVAPMLGVMDVLHAPVL